MVPNSDPVALRHDLLASGLDDCMLRLRQFSGAWASADNLHGNATS